MVEVLNRQKLQRRCPLPWGHLAEGEEVRPERRSLYKPAYTLSKPARALLDTLFKKVGQVFSLKVLIFGFKYRKAQKMAQCQMMNFILGQSKVAVYVSRKKKVEDSGDSDIVLLFSRMVKAQIQIDLFVTEGKRI